jgi:hypothetical protein
MTDAAVVWLMLLIVAVLWTLAAWVHGRTERRITEAWNAKFRRDGRGGPPRVVP